MRLPDTVSPIGEKVWWVEIHPIAKYKLKCISIPVRKMCIVNLGWVYICTYNFFVSGPKFTKFFCPMEQGLLSTKFVSFFRYPDRLPEIFMVKFESCPKSRQILDIFCPPKF